MGSLFTYLSVLLPFFLIRRKCLLVLCSLFLLSGCDRAKMRTDYVPEEFTYELEMSYTPIKNQGRSELCWVYSMLAVLESDHIADGDSIELSTDYIGRIFLEETFRDYYQSGGTTCADLRGVGPMTIELVRRYGALPLTSYMAGRSVNWFRLKSYVRDVADRYMREGRSLTEFSDTMSLVLDKAFGAIPDSVEVDGRMVTPSEYGASLVGGRHFVTLMCDDRHRRGKNVDPLLKDNRYGLLADNVSDDILVSKMVESLSSGHAVMWEGGPNDNHAVAVIGYGHDKYGEKYFVAKNSWGVDNPTEGLYYIEESYVRRHTALVVFQED